MSNEAQAARAGIEAALAAGPTPGTWVGQEFDEALTGDSIPSFVALPSGRNHHDPAIDAAYIAACNPSNIRTLLDDHDAQLRAANERIDALTWAATSFVEIIDKAGLVHLSSGVQLGSTSWYVKASDRLEYLRAALATNQDKPALQPSGASHAHQA